MKSLDDLINPQIMNSDECFECNVNFKQLHNDLLDWVEKEIIGEDESQIYTNRQPAIRNQLRSELRDKVKRERKK